MYIQLYMCISAPIVYLLSSSFSYFVSGSGRFRGNVVEFQQCENQKCKQFVFKNVMLWLLKQVNLLLVSLVWMSEMLNKSLNICLTRLKLQKINNILKLFIKNKQNQLVKLPKPGFLLLTNSHVFWLIHLINIFMKISWNLFSIQLVSVRPIRS